MNKKDRFRGVYAALLTPFDEDGEVSESRLRGLIRFLISKGINGLYICGGTGEGMSMDVEERKKVAEIVKEEVGDKVRVIAHIGGSLNTKNAIELAKHAEKLKLDAVSSIPPLYYKVSFEEIYNYYQKVAGSTALPFLIYYIPSTTGINLSNEKLAELSKIENIIGLKYTAFNLHLLQDLLLLMEGRWIAFSGPDEMFLPALTMGVVGSIGSTQNVLPEIFVGIYQNFLKGKIEEAMALQKRVTIAVSLLLKQGAAAWKTAMRFRGVDAGYARSPLREKILSSAENRLKEEWKKHFPEFSEGI